MRDAGTSMPPEPAAKGWAVYILLFCVAGGVTTAYWGGTRGIILAAALFMFAGSMVLVRKVTGPKMRLSYNGYMIAWIHPECGTGVLAWKDVGALMVQEGKAADGDAVCLVPRDGTTGAGFTITARDLGGKRGEGQAVLRGFVDRIMAYLPSDLTVDRGTRKLLERWGIGGVANRR